MRAPAPGFDLGVHPSTLPYSTGSLKACAFVSTAVGIPACFCSVDLAEQVVAEEGEAGTIGQDEPRYLKLSSRMTTGDRK